MNEVQTIKEGQDGNVGQILKEVKEAQQDSAERAHFLSRYIDEEVVKINNKTSKQTENLKVLCAKLTEQFKKHLINHESMKKDLYKRFEIIESHLPVYRSELYKMMETTEARTLSKLKELKDALSQTILTNFTALDDRVDQFSELVSIFFILFLTLSYLTLFIRSTTIWKPLDEPCKTTVKSSSTSSTRRMKTLIPRVIT